MVPHSLFVEVHILGIASAVAHHLREFQHIVGVARFRTVQMVNIAVAAGCREEVLCYRVATDTYRAVLCHVSPEVFCSCSISGSKFFTLYS